ncbi:hypothetical protein PR003_g27203 [Phytophthora rubi]|uniref:Uncharacterized protein n=1 Tax=Phytophthora rubi TaxID=129364 RepID=A0A6A4C5J3_9STRA|nr:hypothetical protein PR003_g27203 [Phytophthora rubi]
MDKTLGTIRSFDEIGPLGSRAVCDEVNPGSVIRMKLRQEAAEARQAQLIQQAVQAMQTKAAQSTVKEEASPRIPTPQMLSKRGSAPAPEVPVNVEAIQAEAVRRAQEVAQAELAATAVRC